MQFTPKSTKELAEMNLFPAGEYPFEVQKAEDKKSKAGNDMIHLKMVCYAGERQFMIDDYLMEAMPHKLRHFCEATGMLDKYEAGTFSAVDCQGRNGIAKIIIQKDKTGAYPDKNSVKDYVVAKAEKEEPGASAKEDDSDSMPF